jgi:hypothetical protein
VLVRRRDRHRNSHNYDPGGHLHTRLQVRDSSCSFYCLFPAFQYRAQMLRMFRTSGLC